MLGQNHHFPDYAPEKIPYAIDRYVKETNRLYGVLDKRLADRAFVAGDYSIADMACYPWIVPYGRARASRISRISSAGTRSSARPATVRAYALVKEVNPKCGSAIDRGREQGAVRPDRRGGEVGVGYRLGPRFVIASQAKQSTLASFAAWIASRSLSSGRAFGRPVGSQ